MIKILLIDDNYEHAARVWQVLRRNKIINPLSVVTTSAAAFNLLHGANGVLKIDPLPSIIMLDINISRMNGEELLRNLKYEKRLKDIPVLLMINSEGDKELVKNFREIISSYILKPVSVANFALAIAVVKFSWQLKEQPNKDSHGN